MKPEIEQKKVNQEWPRAEQFRRSIRFEFSLYISLAVVVLMAVTGYVMTDMYVRKTTEQVIGEALASVRSYSNTAGKLIISPDKPDALLLNNLLRRLTADYSDAYWAAIAGQDSVFLAHTDMRKVLMADKLERISSDSTIAFLKNDEALDIKGDTILLAVPVTENGIRVGTFATASSTRRIAQARSASIRAVASITVVMILIGIPATMMILNRKLRPVRVIADHLKKVSIDAISLDIPVKTRNELGYLARTLSVMGDRLSQAQKDMIERERINRELEIAREIQSNILPDQSPTGTSFQISCFYRSAREVGGDYYDFIDLDNGNLGIIVADVSGKSLPGMLVMLLTRDIIKSLTRHTTEPAQLLTQVNKELLRNIKKGMFVTMFYGVLDKNTGLLTFASAGHNPLVKFGRDSSGPEILKTRGYPLGMVPSRQFDERIEQVRLELRPADWLIQYTDGISEARNANAEEFGMERFTSILESGTDLSTDDMVARVIEGIDRFCQGGTQFDDITLLALKWEGKSVDKQGSTASGNRGTACVS